MQNIKNRYIVLPLLGFMLVLGVQSVEALAQETRRMPPPPPEAYTACKGKTAGDTAEFVSPRGDKVTGTCKQQGDRLFLVPDNPPPRGRQNNSTQKE